VAATLYVGNLPYDVNDDSLYQHFAAVGNVVSARVVLDRETHRSRGFGFVEMATEDEARAATAQLDGKPLGGRNLRVNPADQKPPPRSGGPRGPRPDR
jgi:RNA recognition motif-containing protein